MDDFVSLQVPDAVEDAATHFTRMDVPAQRTQSGSVSVRAGSSV